MNGQERNRPLIVTYRPVRGNNCQRLTPRFADAALRGEHDLAEFTPRDDSGTPYRGTDNAGRRLRRISVDHARLPGGGGDLRELAR